MTDRPPPVVVVGLDGSDESRSALDWSVRLAGTAGAIHAVHAARRHRDTADVDLEQWVAPAIEAGADIARLVVDDDPADALLGTARDVGADLVAVGVHARSRLAPRTLGRVTTKLVHHAHLPLAVVRPGLQLPTEEGSTVVAGVGRGPATRAALAWAADYAAGHGTALSLIHAVSNVPVFGEDGLLDVLAFYVDRSLLHDWAIEDLEALADDLQRATEEDIEVTWATPDGRAGPALVDAGADATLLVVGRERDGAITDHTMTPTLHHVLTHAPCPVVVVPASAEHG